MNLAVKMPSGETITAPTEEWLAALVVMLPEDARRSICERVAKKVVAYKTPGNLVLHAEGLDSLLKP